MPQTVPGIHACVCETISQYALHEILVDIPIIYYVQAYYYPHRQ